MGRIIIYKNIYHKYYHQLSNYFQHIISKNNVPMNMSKGKQAHVCSKPTTLRQGVCMIGGDELKTLYSEDVLASA